MRNFIFIIFAAALSLGATCTDDECDSDSDCASWQECSADKCIEKPDECQNSWDCGSDYDCRAGECVEKPKHPSGYVVTECTCATTSYTPGQVTNHSMCESGKAEVQVCNYCCARDSFGRCIGAAWRRVCL